MSTPDLRLDWCSHEAAKYAVMNWHYSRRMPTGKVAPVGVWEGGAFIGAVMFGHGANNRLGRPYGLGVGECVELVRVALATHHAPVSQIVSVAIRTLHRQMTGIRLIVSFADPEQDHIGTIYQAGNWVYAGMSGSSDEYIINGRRWHGRALRNTKPKHMTTRAYAHSLDPDFRVIPGSAKYRYLYPLDREMRKQLEPLAKPYPKRSCAGSGDSDTPAVQAGEGGAIPTPALQGGGQA